MIRQQPSPNFDSRGDSPIDMLVLHYTGMKTGEEALARMCDAASRVSAHYLIEINGEVFQLVEEESRAWHAGVASWRGHSNINARSIGIEIVNGGHEWGYTDFPAAQMQAVAELCRAILQRHSAISARNVVAHSDVAPARKQDPGERFDWAWLAEQGVGGWPVSCQSLVVSCQLNLSQLADYGYTAQDATPQQFIIAFQRHFRPSNLSGAWDLECQQRLEWLLEHMNNS